MKHSVLILLGCLLFQTIYAQSGPALKGTAILNASHSAYVIDGESGHVLFETPQVSLVTASVMKVVTTASALEILGADFVFHTQLGMTGKVNSEKGQLEGDLVLKGGCDPAFYSEYFPEHYKGTFESWVAALSMAGVK